MNQSELKKAVAQAALKYVVEDKVVGVGSGSTVNFFIDALAAMKGRIKATVSSSEASAKRLRDLRIPVAELNDTDGCELYVDGADEVTEHLAMIKGGGGALTREKIVASVSDVLVCIADASKRVQVMGTFPLPIEVVPMARTAIGRRVTAAGGVPIVRVQQDGSPYITDNGNEIIDVKGLKITDPRALEAQINAWPGVVTVGLFAARGANLCLLGTENGVERIDYVQQQ